MIVTWYRTEDGRPTSPGTYDTFHMGVQGPMDFRDGQWWVAPDVPFEPDYWRPLP